MYVCLYVCIYYVKKHGSDFTGFIVHDQVLLDGHRIYVCMYKCKYTRKCIHTFIHTYTGHLPRTEHFI